MILSGHKARLGGGWIVHRDRLLDLIDRMRSAIPDEVGEARLVLRDQRELIQGAEEESRSLLRRAQDEANARVDSHDIVLDAQRRASKILEDATISTRQMTEEARGEAAALRGAATSEAVEQTLEADRYSLDMLRRLESQLNALDTSVKVGIEQLTEKLAHEKEQIAADVRSGDIQNRSANSTQQF